MRNKDKNKNKISFSNKLRWSITKISKYDEMADEGFKRAMRYFSGVIALMSIILAIFASYSQIKTTERLKVYVSDNVPEFRIEKEKSKNKKEEEKLVLKLDDNKTVILDNQDFIDVFRFKAVIDLNIKEKDAINEYQKLATNKKTCLVFLKEKCIVLFDKQNQNNENKDKIEYSYSDLLNSMGINYNEDNNNISKNSIINYLNSTPILNYVIIFYFRHFVMLLLFFAFLILVMTLLLLIIRWIKKIEISKKKLICLLIYSFTVSQILYSVYILLSNIIGFNWEYITIPIVLITFVYLIEYFNKNKDNNLHKNQ